LLQYKKHGREGGEMAAAEITTPVLKPYVESDSREFFRIIFVGVLAGIIIPLIGLLITNLLIKPLFCNGGQTTGVCAADGAITGYHTAAIIVGLGAIALFANWGIFRPLPLVLAVTVSLWGLQAYLDPLSTGSWLEFYVFSVVLSALCYLLFYWLMRLRNFPISIISAVIAAALISWAFVS
jgi:hypothetical protein